MTKLLQNLITAFHSTIKKNETLLRKIGNNDKELLDKTNSNKESEQIVDREGKKPSRSSMDR